jgi:hypothetical protein
MIEHRPAGRNAAVANRHAFRGHEDAVTGSKDR